MAIKHMTIDPTSGIREMQINTTLGFHFSPTFKPTKFQKFDKCVGKKNCSQAGERINWYNQYGGQFVNIYLKYKYIHSLRK